MAYTVTKEIIVDLGDGSGYLLHPVGAIISDEEAARLGLTAAAKKVAAPETPAPEPAKKAAAKKAAPSEIK